MKWLDSARAVVERWRTLRELRSLERRETKDSYRDCKNLIVDASEALKRDLRARAIELWTTAQARFPKEVMKSRLALELLLKLNLNDDAEALMQKGRKHYPKDAYFLDGLAEVAYKRGDREEALRRCETLRRNNPGSVKGYWIAAATLSELGRAEEAEALLACGLTVMPDDIGLRMEHARLAERRHGWTEALTRWAVVADAHGHLAGVAGQANALTELGQYDEAEKLLTSVMYKVGNEPTVWITFARVAEHQEDWEEAARRWATIRNRFPLLPLGYVRGLLPLLKLSRHAEAEGVLLEGMDRIRDDATLLIEHAWLAHRRGDWKAAVQRWAVVRERFPGRAEGRERGADALIALGEIDEAAQLRSIAAT
jgi:predicted Zn-dependent protease